MEKAVNFESKGKRLFGILHMPASYKEKIGIIFLNSGPQYRVGPHRMYVKAARKFSRMGLFSLRMDFPGIGDSEGDIDHIDFDCYDPLDTISAVDFLIKEGMEKVVLLGTCAGARNALKSAAKDSRVDSVVLWALPMITFSLYTPVSQKASGSSMSRIAAKRYLKNWMKKAFSIKAWRNYYAPGRDRISIKTLLKNTFLSLTPWNKNANDKRHSEFFKAFATLLASQRKILFVYGEKDVILREEFEAKFSELTQDTKHVCDYYIVPNGDHTFTSLESEKMVIEKTTDWLEENYQLRKERSRKYKFAS